jgi:hypothetical protein
MTDWRSVCGRCGRTIGRAAQTQTLEGVTEWAYFDASNGEGLCRDPERPRLPARPNVAVRRHYPVELPDLQDSTAVEEWLDA